MQRIFAEYGADHHREIIAALAAGTAVKELQGKYKLTAKTIQRIGQKAKKMVAYPLILTDGTQNVPVAEIHTSQGFPHACKVALKRFSGTLNSLELPNWRLVAGKDSIELAKLRKG